MTSKNKIAFFDIETQYLFEDIVHNWNYLKWNEKNQLLNDTTKELKIAIAGVMINDGPINFFQENEIEDLFNTLNSVDLIVGHNLIKFDYSVLSGYISKDQIDMLKSKTIDTLIYIDKITGV